MQVSVKRRTVLRGIAASLLVLGFAASGHGPAFAQGAQQARIIVSFGAGGTNDTLARVMAEKLGPKLGKTVLVEPRPGGGGVVAARHVISSPPDGNTILMSTGSMSIHAAKENPPFDFQKDLVPVVQMHGGTHVLYVNSSLPIKSFADLVAYSKANPDKLSFASFGVGTQTHLAMELFNQKLGTKMIHVPYRSSQETKLAIVKNESQVALEPYQTLKPFIDSGEVRPLAVVAAESTLPGLKGMKALGVEGIDIFFWFGLHVPAGTPQKDIDQLNKAVNEVLKEQEVVAVINRMGASPLGGTQAQLRNIVATEVKMWQDVIKKANLKLD